MKQGHHYSNQEYQVIVAGPFPPPLNGQSLATQQLVEMLSAEFNVRSVNFGWLSGKEESGYTRLQSLHKSHATLREAVLTTPNAVLIYTALSGSLLGYLRNLYAFSRIIPQDTNVICPIHNGNVGELWEKQFVRPTVKLLLDRVTKFIALSETLTKRLTTVVPANRVEVVPNSIDKHVLVSDLEFEQKCRKAASRNELRVLFIGNMIRSKGYMDVVEAIHQLKVRGHKVCADFIGRWVHESDRKDFEKRVKLLGLHRIIRHHGGIVDRQRIKEFLLQADVFVLPSYYPYEAQPITIIEAINAGIPVVATNHAGIPEMIQDGVNGFLIEPHDPVSLTEKIIRFQDIEFWRKMSQEARRSFISSYHPDAVKKRWIELVYSVLI